MIEGENQKTFQWSSARNQYYATIACGLISLSQGCYSGWVSPALSILSAEETPLPSGPLTTDQISWIGSMSALGILFGSITLGFFTSVMGCKRTTLFLAIPFVIFWLLIYFGNNYYMILLARFIGGWAFGGVHTTTILYIAEIANDNIRGQLTGIKAMFIDVGVLIGYILGTSVDYKFVPYICVIIPISFVIVFAIIPNTPQYHLARGEYYKAEVALKFYKGYGGRSDQEEYAINKEFERIKWIAAKQNGDNTFRAADFCNRSALKGLGVGIVLATVSQFSANWAILHYAALIFEKVGLSLDPNLSSIAVPVTLILGSLFSAYLADILGRKCLIFISLIGSAMGLFAVSLYQYLRLNGCDLSAYQWVPVISLSFVVFISSVGIVPLSFVCSLENLPPKIRTNGMIINACYTSGSAFISLKTFPVLMIVLDLYGCLTIYGIGCLVGALFVIFILEETSGKCLDDVDPNKNTHNKKRSDNEDQLLLIPANEKEFDYHTFDNND